MIWCLIQKKLYKLLFVSVVIQSLQGSSPSWSNTSNRWRINKSYKSTDIWHPDNRSIEEEDSKINWDINWGKASESQQAVLSCKLRPTNCIEN